MKDLTWKKILTVVKAMIHCDIDEKKSGRKRNNFYSNSSDQQVERYKKVESRKTTVLL